MTDTSSLDKRDRYLEFLARKIITTEKTGFKPEKLGPFLKPHQRDIIPWALEGGRRAIFCSYGLGKTVMQLEIARLVTQHTGRPFLIGMPLGVKLEFEDDACNIVGVHVDYVRDMQDIDDLHEPGTPAIYLSNYERIREGKFNPDYFSGVSFDEGDAIRNLDTITTQYVMNAFQNAPYRFIATATPSPNDYTEILNYAQFLGVMDRSQALTRFFQRDSTTAGNLTLYEHKEKEFWFWVRSWAVIIQDPSDLGYEEEGYKLPKLNVHYHMVKVGDRGDIVDRDGNLKMFRDASKSLSDTAREKRDSIEARIAKALEIVGTQPDDHFLLWHDLEDERKLLEKALPECRTVYGSQPQEKKEELLIDFRNGKYKYLATKPSICGSGANFQKHCHNAIFCGIGYKARDFMQAIHRIYRYMQDKEVNIHLIYTDAEEQVLKKLLEKWKRHNDMMARMSELIRKYGLSHSAMTEELRRTIGVKRKEESGRGWKAIHNDAVLELQNMEDNSVDMIASSFPFSDQYEYCVSYHDMGHNDGDVQYFEQLDYLTPELLRVVKPGRVACIHVKDRIRFSYQNGVGFTSLNDFSGRTIAHFEKHGWHLLGKHFITTDVVMENNQTYRLGWTEQCKDGTKMGCGSPEYLLVFRKAPTDTSNAYADKPVVKSKHEYTRARWQLDAHAYWKSSGNRLLNPDELRQLDLSQIGAIWKERDTSRVYDHEEHVQICEELDQAGKLPSTFMAVPPRATNPWVWDDVSRMRTLNTSQALRKKEKHVCPLQFDIIDRAITRYTNPGDIVFDPFGGIMSVPYRCISLGRIGIATELNVQYWRDGITYCREAEAKHNVPTLFDLVKEGAA